MIELHIYLESAPGKELELESIFRNDFYPAVSKQDGFQRAVLIKKRDALHEYRITLTFVSEELRVKWATSAKHELVWPKVAAQCLRISWTGFDVMA